MFTRCPKCKEVHPLTAAVLSRSTGLVQCGKCDRIFNALSFLSDDWHASRTFKPVENTGTELPILGGRKRPAVRQVISEPATALQAGPGENEDGSQTASHPTDGATGSQPDDPGQTDSGAINEASSEKRKAGQSYSRLWGLAAAILLVATVVNVAWTFRDYWLQQAIVHQWALNNGWIAPEKLPGMYKSPADIQLVSRDMHTHPTRTGILVLSVTLVNLAQQTQAFPVLRITLLDAGNQPIAQRRLQPAEYLRPGADINAGLAADVFLPVLLELADPGEQAVGFEIEFL